MSHDRTVGMEHIELFAAHNDKVVDFYFRWYGRVVPGITCHRCHGDFFGPAPAAQWEARTDDK